uniref:F-box domain-containing protein n=1 Tax=Biomphalaria glabrata TaxID=6526 RepID=A0A2C9JU29_BIOGL
MEEKQAPKRMKLADDNGLDLHTPRNVIQNNEPDWSLLPYTVLKCIYSLLPRRHQCNMSLACRNWFEHFKASSISRTLILNFNGVDDSMAMRFFKGIFPRGLLYLNIDCRESDGRPLIDEWDSLEYLLMMMKRMLTLRVEKLVCLRLANMSRMIKDYTEKGKRKDLVMALRGFISNQRQLRVLNLSCAGLNLQHGSEVIAKAGRNCGSKIKKLIIDDLFSMDNDDRCANIETLSIDVPEKTENAIEFKKLLMHNIFEYSSGRTNLKEFQYNGRAETIINP